MKMIAPLIIPGAYSNSTTSSHYTYNISTVAASSSENLFNGLGTGAFTTEQWIRLYANESDGNGIATMLQLAGRASGEDDDDLWSNFWLVYINNGYTSSSLTNQGYIVHPDSNGNNQSLTPRLFASGPPGIPSSGAGWSDWLHIVMVRESGTGSNNFKVYVNNTLEETYTTHAVNFTALQFARLLNAYNAASVQQRLGIYRAYKGKALTSSEVTTNWNAQKSRFDTN